MECMLSTVPLLPSCIPFNPFLSSIPSFPPPQGFSECVVVTTRDAHDRVQILVRNEYRCVRD